jgi:hypothetical protein
VGPIFHPPFAREHASPSLGAETHHLTDNVIRLDESPCLA